MGAAPSLGGAALSAAHGPQGSFGANMGNFDALYGQVRTPLPGRRAPGRRAIALRREGGNAGGAAHSA